MAETGGPEKISIRSPEDLKAFLDTRPPADAVHIALRAAWRVMPTLQRIRNAALLEHLALAYFRATLTAQHSPAADVGAHADASAYADRAYAAAAAYAAANAAFDAAYANPAAATHAAAAAAAATSAIADSLYKEHFWLNVEIDCRNLRAGSDILACPLWESEPGWFEAESEELFHRLRALDDNWSVLALWFKQIQIDATIDPFTIQNLNGAAIGNNIFWGDDDDRTPNNVMADIAERLGWSGRAEKPNTTMKAFIVDHLDDVGTPVSIDEFVTAFGLAGYDVLRTSIRGRLNALTRDKKIRRVDRGVYASLGKGSSSAEWPEPVEDAKSPFSYGWGQNGKIGLAGDALSAIAAAKHRSPEDASNRLDAARQLAKSLAEGIQGGQYQVSQDYASGLSDYAEHLPHDHSGNIYLADSALRTLRDDLQDDIASGYVPDKFARRVKRVIEAHYGLRVYFPDLLGFYDDIKRGELTEPPPIEALNQLSQTVAEFTPDVFEDAVKDSVGPDTWPTYESSKHVSPLAEAPAETSVTLPPDPIADVDPVRADQAARAGAFNRLWGVLRKPEKAADNIERAEKAAGTFAKHIGSVIDFLSNMGG